MVVKQLFFSCDEFSSFYDVSIKALFFKLILFFDWVFTLFATRLFEIIVSSEIHFKSF